MLYHNHESSESFHQSTKYYATIVFHCVSGLYTRRALCESGCCVVPDFLGRTEIRIADIHKDSQQRMGPISKRLKLLEVDSGEVIVKLTLQLFNM